jgi:hypothetical protein
MLTLVESKIHCPRDGSNLFNVQRELDVGTGDIKHEDVVCRTCDARKYLEILRHASRIILLRDIGQDDAANQKLKTS